jgi:excisionase family DNA binding protein
MKNAARDLVKQLRRPPRDSDREQLMRAAADEIERQEKEICQQRRALAKPCKCKPHFLSPPTLARALGVSPITVRSWISRGHLPAAKRVGNTLLWPVSELESWYAARPSAPGRRRAKANVFDKPSPASAVTSGSVAASANPDMGQHPPELLLTRWRAAQSTDADNAY